MKKINFVGAKLTDEQQAKFAALCRRFGLNQSDMMRKLIAEYSTK